MSEPRSLCLTFIGDSTVDNRVWVDGFIKSSVKTKLNIRRGSADERVAQSHRVVGKPALSVVENVKDLMPEVTVHDF